MLIPSLKKNNDESISAFCYRLFTLKEGYGLSWDDIKDTVNANYGANLSIDAVRKRAKRFGLNECPEIDEPLDNITSTLEQNLNELRYERTKIADERNQANAIYRRIARENTIKEIAHDFAQQMGSKLKFDFPNNKVDSDNNKVGILCVSDVHYGLEVNSAFNQYSTSIAQERLNKLLNKTVEYVGKEKLNQLIVVNLGDLIAGRIHTTIRLNSRIDVITQTMEVSELLAQFLAVLSSYVDVHYVSTSDNHSRVEPKKSESLELESLIRITDWFIRERCKGIITFSENEFGNDIASFSVNGFNVVAVHGDKDKPTNAIQNLRLLTGVNFDVCLLAHRHHFSADENCGTVLIANGSVCGTDQFAQDLRLHSTPSQNLIIVGEDNPVECIYKINLD